MKGAGRLAGRGGGAECGTSLQQDGDVCRDEAEHLPSAERRLSAEHGKGGGHEAQPLRFPRIPATFEREQQTAFVVRERDGRSAVASIREPDLLVASGGAHIARWPAEREQRCGHSTRNLFTLGKTQLQDSLVLAHDLLSLR